MVESKEVKKAEAPKLAKKQHHATHKSVKHPWTLDRCLKVAKRYESVEAWREGAPACYKAAEAHGWSEVCAKHFHRPAQQQYRKSA